MSGRTIVRFGFILSGALFLFAAVKPAFVGGSVNAAFLVLGAASAVLGVAVGRNPGGRPPQGPPPNA